ncbi:hypothetical protein [Campylobacter lanienae]|uniref:hypothetical protein n=1 Tax=Campylobacter lanienae TaxID=75658 RepID=UPI000BB41319|nr:hypothetical protein [Campylobacter lanienae]
MFKRVGRDIKDIEAKADEFINSTSDKEVNSDNEVKMAFKIPKLTRKNIKKMIAGTIFLNKYYPMILKKDLDGFSDEDIMNIYREARMQNISMRDYVRIKLKLMKPNEIEFISYPTERDLTIEFISLSKTDKELITQRAKNLNAPMMFYGCVKMMAHCELALSKLFNQIELELLKEEAKKSNLSLKEYLSKKINEEL